MRNRTGGLFAEVFRGPEGEWCYRLPGHGASATGPWTAEEAMDQAPDEYQLDADDTPWWLTDVTVLQPPGAPRWRRALTSVRVGVRNIAARLLRAKHG